MLTLFFLIPIPWVGMGLIVGCGPQTIVGTQEASELSWPNHGRDGPYQGGAVG